MRDAPRLEQLITLLAGLDHIHFNLDVDVCYLDMSTYCQQDASLPPDLPILFKCNSTMTASITSSLASPVDSGVALLDSDADGTSVSETTQNGDNISLKEDDSTLAELDDGKFIQTSLSSTLMEETPVVDGSSCISLLSGVSEYNGADGNSEEFLEAARNQCPQNQIKTETESTLIDTHHTNTKVDIERGLLQDAASNFIRNAVFHAAFITKGANSKDILEEDKPIITITKAQCPEESHNSIKSIDEYSNYLPFCEPEMAIEVYEVCPVMTASDIVNQNTDPVDTFGAKGEGLSASNAKCNKSHVEKDIFKDTQMKGQQHNVNTTSSDCDEIVFRRQRKKKSKNDVKIKRVSFHEDLIVSASEDVNSVKSLTEGGGNSAKRNESISDFSASFLPPNPIIKKDVVRGRYSWCAEGDAPYVSQRNNTNSEVFLPTKSGSSCNDTIFKMNDNVISTSTHNPLQSNQLLNVNVNDRTLSIGNETNLFDKHDFSVQNLGYVQSHDKSFPDRFLPQQQYSLFGDGNDTMLQMDALIQSTPPTLDCKKMTTLPKSVPVTERGTPEGQEDPQRSCCSHHLCSSAPHNYSSHNLNKFPSFASSIDCFTDTESLHSDPEKHLNSNIICNSNKISQLDRLSSRRHSNVREFKKSLLHRFLKSVTIKKFIEKKVRIIQPTRSLFIKGVKVDPDMQRDFVNNLNAEILKGQMETFSNYNTNIPVDSSLEMIFKSQIYSSGQEHVDKVFRVRSSYYVGEVVTPLLVLLTNANLYITGSKMNHTYHNHLVLPYNNLDSILVGPNCHNLMLVPARGNTHFTITTGDSDTTNAIISCIELRMRANGLNPPAVRILQLEDMRSLRHSIRKSVDMSEDELVQYYSLVHLQDDQHSSPSSPLGPTMEGHLMFRPATHTPLQPWAPAYCVLKAGVLYMFSESDHLLPKRVLMLRNGHCKGCLRLQDRRPHTFAILLQGSGERSLQFAAADEYQASDWLQAFIQAAAGVEDGEGIEPTPCSLILTSRHVFTCREEFPSGKAHSLAVANIADIVAFRAEHRWCVLEFACREVHETSGDWVLYFASVKEMEKFQVSLQDMWTQIKQSAFPLSAVIEESQRQRCLETGHILAQMWEHLVPLNKTK